MTFDVDAANHIYPIIKMTKEFKKRITLFGGAEAHLMAKEIAAANISVIFSPARCTPETWFNQDCRVTSTNPSALHILQSAGVNVGVSFTEDNFARGLIWEAGWQIADLPDYQSLDDFQIAQKSAALTTWNIAKAYGLENVGTIQVGRRPNFVVYDGVPGTLAAEVTLVVDGNLVETNTTQY